MENQTNKGIIEVVVEAISKIVSDCGLSFGIYTSVPNTAQLPYITIQNIRSNSSITVDPSIFMTELKLIAFDKNRNAEVLGILASSISDKIYYQVLNIRNKNISIKNAFVDDYEISEIIEQKTWQYSSCVTIIYKATE